MILEFVETRFFIFNHMFFRRVYFKHCCCEHRRTLSLIRKSLNSDPQKNSREFSTTRTDENLNNKMHCKRETEDTPSVNAFTTMKKRKTASDAEKVAVELSKINFSHEIKHNIKIEKSLVKFPETSRHFQRNQCTWRDSKSGPCYCEKAKLKFEASLPDRSYLTRFSVRCTCCYNDDESTMHLYCAYCDEVLTGTIAGPGGKVSDHLITIRHVYQQAQVLKGRLENGDQNMKLLAQARDYVSKFEEWSKRIRYPVKTTVQKSNIQEVLKDLQQILARLCPPMLVCFDIQPLRACNNFDCICASTSPAALLLPFLTLH
jgi:hypothetical protein